jgi:hypothetical protein
MDDGRTWMQLSVRVLVRRALRWFNLFPYSGILAAIAGRRRWTIFSSIVRLQRDVLLFVCSLVIFVHFSVFRRSTVDSFFESILPNNDRRTIQQTIYESIPS